MANQKITELDAGTVADGDLIAFVDDPSGAAQTKKDALSSDPGAGAAPLMTDSSGYLHLRQLELAQTGTGDSLLMYIDPADADSKDWRWAMNTSAQAGRDNVTLNWGYNNAAGGGCEDNADCAFYTQLESFYTTGGVDYFEYHLNFYDINDANPFRPLQINVSRDDYDTLFQVKADTISLFSRSETNGIGIIPGTSITALDPVTITETSTSAFLVQSAVPATTMLVDTTNARCGIGGVTPGYTLHVQSHAEQMRLQYDTTNYAGFTVGSTGTLTIAPYNSFVLDRGTGSNVKFFLNETANAKMTFGVTLNQGADVDEILAFKSDQGVAHGATDITETDTYGLMMQSVGNGGGLLIKGLKEGSAGGYAGIHLEGYIVDAADTTKSDAGRAIAEVYGYNLSGTGKTDTTADGNVFAVRTQRSSADVTVFIVDEDGDLHADGSFDNVYDGEDDALAVANLAQGLAQNWNETMRYNFDKLRAMGVISGGTIDRPFISWKNLNALYMGAIAQLAQRVQALEAM